MRRRALSEAQWQEQLVAIARAAGWLVYHPHDSRHSESGYPDLTLVRERVVFVEVKAPAPKGALSYEQAVWLDRMLKAHAEVYIGRESDTAALDAILLPSRRLAPTWVLGGLRDRTLLEVAATLAKPPTLAVLSR